MPTSYLTCEADLNFPHPNVDCVVAKLRLLANDNEPVTTKDIAIAVGCDALTVEAVLRRASHCGLVRRIHEKGWIPAIA